MVKAGRADIGLVHDADGERLGLVDETGRALSEEMTLALATDIALGERRRAGRDQRLHDDGRRPHRRHARRHRSSGRRSGQPYISEAILEHGAVIGGEGNGSVAVPRVQASHDSAAATGLLLWHLAGHGAAGCRRWPDALPQLAMVKDHLPIEPSVIYSALQEFRDARAGRGRGGGPLGRGQGGLRGRLGARARVEHRVDDARDRRGGRRPRDEPSGAARGLARVSGMRTAGEAAMRGHSNAEDQHFRRARRRRRLADADLLTRFAQAFGTYMGIRPRRRRPRHAHVGRDGAAGRRRGPALGGLPHRGRRRLPDADRAAAGAPARGRRAASPSPRATTRPSGTRSKFVGPDALFLSGARGRELLDIYHQGEYTTRRGRRHAGHRRPCRTLLDLHVTRGARCRRRPAVPRGRRLRVVLDSVQRRRIDRRRRGCSRRSARTWSAINTTPDGLLPAARRADRREPVGALRRGAVAVAPTSGSRRTWTPTGWRSSRSEASPSARSGRWCWPCEHVLARTPGTVVTNLSTTHGSTPRQRGPGAACVRTPVGEANVTEGMQRHARGDRRRGQRRRHLPARSTSRATAWSAWRSSCTGWRTRAQPLSSLVAALPPSRDGEGAVPVPVAAARRRAPARAASTRSTRWTCATA